MVQTLLKLEELARREVAGSRVIASDGTVIFTPDGQGCYRGVWVRDFAYLVQNAYDLLQPQEVSRAIMYLLKHQRADGCIPDRVQVDGKAIYLAGHPDKPLGGPPTDNSQFIVSLVYAYVQQSGDLDFARQNLKSLQRALDFTPRSSGSLVYISPEHPQSPWGFTDTIAKTGELLFSSLLYWVSCKEMVELCNECGEDSSFYHQRAAHIEKGLDRLWDDENGVFRAASLQCCQIDVWGNAYAVYCGCVQDERRQRILDFLHSHYDDYVWHGQVRHLLLGEYWERTLNTLNRYDPGTYQNGAYWSTASGWVLYSLAQIDGNMARQMLADLLQDFQEAGVYECININYRKSEHFVASVVNPLGALRRVPWLSE